MWGSIQIYPSKGADQSISASVEYNAMAVYGGELLFLSAVGSAADLKVIRAVVNSNGSIPAYFRASGLQVSKPSRAHDRYHYARNPGTLSISLQGYNIYKHCLGFGQEHNLFVSRKDGFLLMSGDESVWRELKSDRITTPLVREWLPYIASRLREDNLLAECDTHPYSPKEGSAGAPVLTCSVFTASTKQVDDIVMDGLRQGKIRIPEVDRHEQLPAAI